jgi:hypothetical protein
MALRLAVRGETSVDGKNVFAVVNRFAALSNATVPPTAGKVYVCKDPDAVNVIVSVTVSVFPGVIASVPPPSKRLRRVETGKTAGVTDA